MGKRPGIGVGTPVLTFGTGTETQNLDRTKKRLDRDSRFDCGTQKLDGLEQIFTGLDPEVVVLRDRISLNGTGPFHDHSW